MDEGCRAAAAFPSESGRNPRPPRGCPDRKHELHRAPGFAWLGLSAGCGARSSFSRRVGPTDEVTHARPPPETTPDLSGAVRTLTPKAGDVQTWFQVAQSGAEFSKATGLGTGMQLKRRFEGR